MLGNREVQLAQYAKKALDEAQHQIDGLRKEIQEAEGPRRSLSRCKMRNTASTLLDKNYC